MKHKIKVLECIRQGQIGGGESHLLSLVENIDRSQFDPVVLSFTDGPMIERLKDMGVESTVIYTERPFDVSKWKQVKRFLQEKKVDLIHAHGTRANSNVLWAARSLGIPVVYTVHGWSFHQDQKPLVRRIRILGEKYLTSRADVNISVSSSNQLSGKNYIPSFHSVVINNGIDLRKFNPDKAYKDVRAEYGIAADELLVLFIARFTHQKQPLALIRAFAAAAGEAQKMRLLLIGDGEQKAEAVSLIRELGLENRVILEKFRQDVPDVLAAADIYVLPSLWEGLPIGLLEALAMGKPVIASRVDGTVEVIQHEENGLLIDTDNLVDNLKNALVRLAKEESLRHYFRAKAVQTISERYNAANMTRQIEEVYRKIVSKKKSSA